MTKCRKSSWQDIGIEEFPIQNKYVVGNVMALNKTLENAKDAGNKA